MNILLWSSAVIFSNQLCFPIRFHTSVWSTQRHPISVNAWYIGIQYFSLPCPLILCLISHWSLLQWLPDNFTQANTRFQTRHDISKRLDDCWPEDFCENVLLLSQAIWKFFYQIYKHALLIKNGYDWKVGFSMLLVHYYGMWPFCYLGVQENLWVVKSLDSDVIDHSNNLNKVGMDLDIFTSRYTINSHAMIFLVIDQFKQLPQLFQYDIPFYRALWKAFSWSHSWSCCSGKFKTLSIFFDRMKFKLS